MIQNATQFKSRACSGFFCNFNVMKRIFTALLVCLACQLANCQKVEVRFLNKTGHELDTLIINGKLLTQLKHNQTSEPVYYKELLCKGRLPMLTGKCRISNGDWIEVVYLAASSNQFVKRLDKGSYTLMLATGFVDSKVTTGKVLALFVSLKE